MQTTLLLGGKRLFVDSQKEGVFFIKSGSQETVFVRFQPGFN